MCSKLPGAFTLFAVLSPGVHPRTIKPFSTLDVTHMRKDTRLSTIAMWVKTEILNLFKTTFLGSWPDPTQLFILRAAESWAEPGSGGYYFLNVMVLITLKYSLLSALQLSQRYVRGWMETNSHIQDIVESCTCDVTMVNNTLSSYGHTAIPELHLEMLSRGSKSCLFKIWRRGTLVSFTGLSQPALWNVCILCCCICESWMDDNVFQVVLSLSRNGPGYTTFTGVDRAL